MSSVGAALDSYTTPWQQLTPLLKGAEHAANRIYENYQSGVFVGASSVPRLIEDINGGNEVGELVAREFSDGRLRILMAALDQAERAGQGLLEATEVIEPNPTDLNSSHCLSNLLNCDPSGAMLYQRAVQQQFGEIGLPRELLTSGAVQHATSHVDLNVKSVSDVELQIEAPLD